MKDVRSWQAKGLGGRRVGYSIWDAKDNCRKDKCKKKSEKLREQKAEVLGV